MSHDEMIAAIAADRDGKPMDISIKGMDNWEPLTGATTWNFSAFDFRERPEKAEPKKRLIRMDELPTSFWVKYSLTSYLVSEINDDHIGFSGCVKRWNELTGYQWSSDRKTWHSFEVEEA